MHNIWFWLVLHNQDLVFRYGRQVHFCCPRELEFPSVVYLFFSKFESGILQIISMKLQYIICNIDNIAVIWIAALYAMKVHLKKKLKNSLIYVI